MKVKIVPCLFFLLNTFLFATYYSVSKEALGRIEPIIFSFIEMVTLLPAGICILILTRKDVSKALVKRGVLVGSWLCLALFTIAIALMVCWRRLLPGFFSVNLSAKSPGSPDQSQ